MGILLIMYHNSASTKQIVSVKVHTFFRSSEKTLFMTVITPLQYNGNQTVIYLSLASKSIHTAVLLGHYTKILAKLICSCIKDSGKTSAK